MKNLLCAVSSAAILLAACKEAEKPAPPPPPAAVKKMEAQSKQVATAKSSRGEPLALKLSYAPQGAFMPTTLVLDGAGAGKAIWGGFDAPEQVQALFASDWRLAAEPAPGERLAVSTDGGKTWRPAFGSAGSYWVCPHFRVPAAGDQPDWSKMPALADFFAGVFETAVWGCGDGISGCKSRSLANLPVHHSEPGDDPLATPHALEMVYAIEWAEGAPIDRRIAAGLVDAAVGYQPKLDREHLRRLGALAARALADDGPLSPEERRAFKLRVALAQQEVKTSPADQLSPRESIDALAKTLAVPTPVGAKQ